MSEIDTSAPKRLWAGPDDTDKMWDVLTINDDIFIERPKNSKPSMPGWLTEYVRADLYDAMRERAEKVKAERDALAKAIKRVQHIRQDMDDFDGDRRGHMAALDSAEEAAVRLANDALRNEGDDDE